MSGRFRGGAWWACSPTLFLDQNETRRAEKIFFLGQVPRYLRVWMTGPPPPPLSEGVDLPLVVIIILKKDTASRAMNSYF